jgi:hypothetical protein
MKLLHEAADALGKRDFTRCTEVFQETVDFSAQYGFAWIDKDENDLVGSNDDSQEVGEEELTDRQ